MYVNEMADKKIEEQVGEGVPWRPTWRMSFHQKSQRLPVRTDDCCGVRAVALNFNPANGYGTIASHPDFDFSNNPRAMKEITVQELKALRESGEPFQLIDVREPYEYEIANLGGELIPLAQLAWAPERVSRTGKVVVHCRGGGRSSNIIRLLEERFGFENLYNLRGGISAWAEQVDPDMPKY